MYTFPSCGPLFLQCHHRGSLALENRVIPVPGLASSRNAETQLKSGHGPVEINHHDWHALSVCVSTAQSCPSADTGSTVDVRHAGADALAKLHCSCACSKSLQSTDISGCRSQTIDLRS